MVASSWIGMTALLIALADLDAQTAGAPSSTEKAAVDALIVVIAGRSATEWDSV